MEILNFVLKNLTHRKLRTILTILGISIGIAAIVALVSLGDGLKYSITEQLNQLGPDRIIVMPQYSFSGGAPNFGSLAESLGEKDLNVIKRINGVDKAIPVLYKTMSVKYAGETKSIGVMGVPAKETEYFFSDIQTFEIEEGRFMTQNEKFACVLGNLLKKTIFSNEVRIRSRIEISGTPVKVVGILKALGNREDDSTIIMPLDGMREIINSKDEITMIMLKATDDPKKVAEKIEREMDNIHGKDTFIAMTTDQILEKMNNVFNIITIVFLGIAGISLIVAGFGIMNTMLMSVLERTREIGTMKAVGATNKRILGIFITESSFVGFIGGIIGIIAGIFLYSIVADTASQMIGITMPSILISPITLISVLCFSVFVGIISGVYPAWRASKLNPVDALRYE